MTSPATRRQRFSDPMPPAPRSMPRRPSAFTLIELLVVMAIIAILLGLGFAGVSGALRTAKKTEARAMANQIKAAIAAYHAEYGTYPTNNKADATFVEIMTAAKPAGNRRGIRFLEVPPKFLATNTIATPERLYSDPKKREVYNIATDAMGGAAGKPYDGKIKLPDGQEVSGSVAVWVTDPEKPTSYLGTW